MDEQDWFDEAAQYAALSVLSGRWWRCRRYEIRDGHVCPAPRAKPEIYDPTALYTAARAGKTFKETPYQSLVALLRDLEIKPGSSSQTYTLTPSSEKLLLSWCARYGLLGILPQRTLMVTLHPRWRRRPSSRQASSEDRALYPVQYSYIRESIGWTVYNRLDRGRRRAEDDAASGRVAEGDLVAEQDYPEGWERPGALIRPLTSPRWRWTELRRTWARFLPMAPSENPQTFAYPLPGSKEFLKSYSEPIEDFLQGAITLRDILQDLGRRISVAEGSREDDVRIRDALTRLNLLAEPLSPALLPGKDGSYRWQWVSPTLLASMAMMVLQDLADPRARLLRCQACDTIFMSTSYQAAYCSRSCRRTAYKRRRRSRPTKRAPARAGVRRAQRKRKASTED